MTITVPIHLASLRDAATNAKGNQDKPTTNNQPTAIEQLLAGNNVRKTGMHPAATHTVGVTNPSTRGPSTWTVVESKSCGCNKTGIKREKVIAKVSSGDRDHFVDEKRYSIGKQGRTVQDLINKVNSQVEANQCVSELVLNSHGSGKRLWWGIAGRKEEGEQWPAAEVLEPITHAEDITIDNIAAFGTELKKQVCFCDPCVIYVASCFSGRHIGGLKILAQKSGCKVVAPKNNSTTYLRDVPQNWGVLARPAGEGWTAPNYSQLGGLSRVLNLNREVQVNMRSFVEQGIQCKYFVQVDP